MDRIIQDLFRFLKPQEAIRILDSIDSVEDISSLTADNNKLHDAVKSVPIFEKLVNSIQQSGALNGVVTPTGRASSWNTITSPWLAPSGQAGLLDALLNFDGALSGDQLLGKGGTDHLGSGSPEIDDPGPSIQSQGGGQSSGGSQGGGSSARPQVRGASQDRDPHSFYRPHWELQGTTPGTKNKKPPAGWPTYQWRGMKYSRYGPYVVFWSRNAEDTYYWYFATPTMRALRESARRRESARKKQRETLVRIAKVLLVLTAIVVGALIVLVIGAMFPALVAAIAGLISMIGLWIAMSPLVVKLYEWLTANGGANLGLLGRLVNKLVEALDDLLDKLLDWLSGRKKKPDNRDPTKKKKAAAAGKKIKIGEGQGAQTGQPNPDKKKGSGSYNPWPSGNELFRAFKRLITLGR